MADIIETSACALPPRKQKQSRNTTQQESCMTAAAQIQRSHLPQGSQGPLWAGGNRVGNYTNSEEKLHEDTFFNTPFEGTAIREDGTAGIVTDDDDYTGKIRPYKDRLPVEAGRYRLIWTPLCPWATRVKITLNLLGIKEDVISTGKTDPVKTEEGWSFASSDAGRDSILGIRTLPEIYEKTEPGGKWNATVPTLVDVRNGVVANNDYHRLPLYLETAFRPFFKEDAPDLYPVKLRSQIDRLDRILFNDVENRVYQAGYAETQEEYEHSFYIFFNRLNWLDRYLGSHRFLMGDRITDPDIRLYVTLARLDAAYYFEFRLNALRLRDYPNLWRYARELYANPAFSEATDFDAIKQGYYLGPAAENPFRIVPKGPDESVWKN